VDFLSTIWNEALLKPMTNGLVLLYLLLFNNFGLALLAFTILSRAITFPLTLKQLRQTRAMGRLQPKIAEVQKRYAKDRQRISQETMKLYREEGVNPIGCIGPLIVQMPIFISLYWALIRLLPSSPENVVDLSELLYNVEIIHKAIPLNSIFLGLDMAQTVSELPALIPGLDFFTIGIPLAILVGGSMWVQQKMMMQPSADPRQQQTQKIMLWMMPLMFTFFTFSFPSGLAFYWIFTNVVGVAIQYRVTGWGGLRPGIKPAAPVPQVPLAKPEPAVEEQEENEQYGSERKDPRRSVRNRPKGPRSRPRRGRSRGH
jgi:YidC/Oxa1 family membrane protein insertase